jgi:beta-1,4-mannosyltransferase
MGLFKIIVQLFFGFLPFVAVVVYFKKPRRRLLHRRSVAVLVLGDIGRSPRMMYHSQSFAQHDFETFVIGYAGALTLQHVETA